MKKKPIIHLYGPSITHTYTTVCGQSINAKYEDTLDKRKVTCKKCKRSARYKKPKAKRCVS